MKSKLIEAYRYKMERFLLSTTNLSKEDINSKLSAIIKDKYRPDNITIVGTDKFESVTMQKTDLLNLIETKTIGNSISPSGSVYIRADIKRAFTSQFIDGNTKKRKVFKKRMMEAVSSGNEAEEQMNYCLQTFKKIINNSFSGACMFEYSFLYDKGNYNAITSIGRSLIYHSIIEAENILGNNFSYFNESVLVDRILDCLDGIKKADIRLAAQRYSLKIPSKKELYTDYLRVVKKYSSSGLLNVKKIIESLDDEEVIFLYYQNNLKRIMEENSTKFKQFIQDVLDISKIRPSGKPEDIFKLDPDLIALVSLAFSKSLLNGMQAYELPVKDPEKARLFVSVAKKIETQLTKLDLLFKVFINDAPLNSNILEIKDMDRKVTTFSDTDSISLTLATWVKWYVGDIIETQDKSYQIVALCIYWFTKIIKATLKKFSIAHGAVGEFSNTIKMKNELLFICQILYNLKKNYANIINMQEGVLLPEIMPEIKGAVLRSSDIPEATALFNRDLIIEKILKKAMTSKISGRFLLTTVINFENEVRASILKGEVKFLKRCSIKPLQSYDNILSTSYFYYTAYSNILSYKYGEVLPPFKTPVIPLIKITLEILLDVKKINNKVYNNFIKFFDEYNKFPSYIIIPPALKKIPKEILPLIDLRHVIYFNARVAHITLERLHLGISFDKQKLLMSDLYCG